MTTELRRGGIFTKINLKGYLKDTTNNSTILIETTAIMNDKRLTFYIENEKYILKIISPTEIILNRNNDEINSTIYFVLNKTKPAEYTIKENGLSLQINIKTNKIELNNEYIKISYTVIDSETNYEYYIEMSE